MALLSRRTLARAGVAAAAFAAAGTFVAVPARAAAPAADLTLTIAGTTVAATTSGKLASVTLGNKGPEAATGVTVTFDLSELDPAKAMVVPLVEDPDACEVQAMSITCPVTDIAVGESPEVLFVVAKAPDEQSPLGKLTVTVAHGGTETDAQQADNAATVDVVSGTSGPSGPDLVVVAFDVPTNDDLTRTETLAPGATGPLVFGVANQGDEFVEGVNLTIALPDHVSFGDLHESCTAAPDGRSAVCAFANLPLVPVQDDDPEKEPHSTYLFEIVELKVADDAPASVNLAGGTVTAEPVIAAPTIAKLQAASLPAGVTAVAPESLDVDPSDNVDEYVVYVGEKPADGGNGGSGGSLPITGVQVGVIGAVGVAIIALGGTLVLLARRRRIVTVTPDDESSGE